MSDNQIYPEIFITKENKQKSILKPFNINSIESISQVLRVGAHTILKSSDEITKSFEYKMNNHQLYIDSYFDYEHSDCYTIYVDIHDNNIMYYIL
jgi:hypothetical protein